MCRKVTIRILAATGVLMSVGFVFAQSPVLDWRHIGNSAVELSLPSVATGPVDRVWYSEDGSAFGTESGNYQRSGARAEVGESACDVRPIVRRGTQCIPFR